ncbi:hypothetical protein AB4Y96_24710 [Phyllobacterium sp. TAF24]|uniref:hypothetical protein n=1 Tax=Phyllobacterium sp. TAF24 TaxID=3233068 RepID=UPI003F99A0D2
MRPTTSLKSGLHLMAATTALVVVFAGSAYAVDGNAVAARLKGVYSEYGATLEYSNVESSGSTIVLKDTKVSGKDGKDSFKVGDVTLSDVADADAGGFKIGLITVPDVDYTSTEEGKGRVIVQGISMEGVTLPPENSTDPLAQVLQFEKTEIKHISVSEKGKEALALDDISGTRSPISATAPVNFTSNIGNFKADLSEVEDPKTKDALKALGYETLSGKFDMGGTWNMTDGRINVEKMNVTFNDAGALGIKLDLAGITPDFLKSAKEATKKVEGKPDDAQAMAMLGLMQQLSFTGASIRFDDGSLTNKALDYAAKQQGMKRDDLVNQGKAILPMMAAQLGNAEFAQALGTAVSAYLDSPKNIEIKAAPGKSVPFAIIAAGGMADPKSLIKTLGVTVNANQ